MDDYRFGYYREVGYDDETESRILANEGRAGVLRYWERFNPHSIMRLLEEHRGSVIDMGGGSMICESDEQLKRVQALLQPYSNVVLLMPFEDREQSLLFLKHRLGANHGTSTVRPQSRCFDIAAPLPGSARLKEVESIVLTSASRVPSMNSVRRRLCFFIAISELPRHVKSNKQAGAASSAA
jgi:hypothetical protein